MVSIIKNRNYLFDNLKGFLIICVIIGNSLEYINPTSIDLHFFILFLYIFHMPLFSFISGYFNNKSTRTTQENVVGILKIYLFSQILYYIINILIFENSSYNLEFFSPAWTMWYFLSLMSWYIISDFIKNKKRWLLISILISLYIGFDSSVSSYASISRTFFFLPYFIAGMCFKEDYFEKLKHYRYKLAIISFVFIFILYVLSDSIPIELLFEYTKYSTYFDNLLFPFSIRIFHYICSILVGAFIISVASKEKTILSFLGKSSVVLYVCHGLIIRILHKYSFLNYSTPLNILVSELTIIIITILFSLLYVYLIPIIKNITLKLRV